MRLTNVLTCSVLVVFLFAGFISCGGGGGGGHTPVISNPSLSPDWFTQGDGGGVAEIYFTVQFSDSGGDLRQIVLDVYNTQDIQVIHQVVDVIGADGITLGYLQGSVEVNTTAPDIYSFEAWALDSGDRKSNTLTGTVTVWEKIALTAEGVSDKEVLLNWTDPYGGQKGFTLERSLTPSSGYDEVADVAASAANFVDTGRNGVVNNTTYYYRVRAADAPNHQLGWGYSDPVEVTTPLIPIDTPTVFDPAMTMTVVASLPDDIKGVEIAGDGDILLAAGRAVYKVDRGAFTVSPYSTGLGGSGDQVWDLAVDETGRVFATVCWISNDCDIMEIYADGSAAPLYTGPMNGAGVDAGAASTLYLGNTGGALYALGYNGVASTLLDVFYEGPSLQPNIYGVAALAGGELAFGHRYEGRLYKTDPAGNVVTLANLPRYYIFSLVEAAPGTLYISGTWPDVAVFRLREGVLSLLAAGLDGRGSIDALSVNGAFGIAVDSTGALFVASGQELWMIDYKSP